MTIFINLFNSFNSSLLGPVNTTVLNKNFSHPSNLIKEYSFPIIFFFSLLFFKFGLII